MNPRKGIPVSFIKSIKLFTQLFGSIQCLIKSTNTTIDFIIIFDIMKDINGINPDKSIPT